MRTAKTPFQALVDGLQGRPPGGVDWLLIVEAANRYLVTPTLFHALSRSGAEAVPEDVPEDVMGYLRFIHDRNRDRNIRLRAQAVEAVEALNRCGIRPLLLKGACILLTVPDSAIGTRILTDLDLVVPQERISDALACLARLGYDVLPDAVGEHAQAALARPQDAGSIDLHHRPPGPSAFHHPERLAGSAKVLCVGDGHALLPSPTFRALHLIVHDILHDQQDRTGAFDLRHLCDLNDLARMPGGVDWDELAALMAGGSGRGALETQLVALRGLFGTTTPVTPRYRIRPLLHHWRRMQQASHPARFDLLRTTYRMLYKRPKAVIQAIGPKRTAV